ncbi:MAG: glutathione S-transferase N-terminal domain-containing protein [Myxococcota bacterium]
MIRSLNDVHSWVASVARGPRGLVAWTPARRQPEQTLELYEFEACPFCRKVREALSELDLEYVSRPVPRGEGPKRAFVEREGGRRMFPFLVDPDSGARLYESEDIVSYLHETYGAGRSTAWRLLSPVNTLGAATASVIRPRGGRVRPGCESREQPERLLELWNFEASPFCRKVREALCALNLDYLVHNVAKRSARRPRLVALGGRMMVPYLVDPNAGVAMYESDDIVAYLERTYAG